MRPTPRHYHIHYHVSAIRRCHRTFPAQRIAMAEPLIPSLVLVIGEFLEPRNQSSAGPPLSWRRKEIDRYLLRCHVPLEHPEYVRAVHESHGPIGENGVGPRVGDTFQRVGEFATSTSNPCRSRFTWTSRAIWRSPCITRIFFMACLRPRPFARPNSTILDLGNAKIGQIPSPMRPVV